MNATLHIKPGSIWLAKDGRECGVLKILDEGRHSRLRFSYRGRDGLIRQQAHGRISRSYLLKSYTPLLPGVV